MSLRISFTKTLSVAADDDGISLSQTPLAAGNLTITGALASGGVASLTTQRRVILTFAGSEVGHNFTLVGTQGNGQAITEVIAGTAAGVVQSLLDYMTVTRVSIDAAATGAIKVGTNGVGSSHWIVPNYEITPFAVGFGVVVSGTVNYTMQHTFDNPLAQVASNFPPAPAVIPTAFPHAIVAAQTANADGNYAFPCNGIRLLINSGTGSATLSLFQAGIRN